jgi:L-seryl-tRNA(Ser) seleniumtransferase
MSTTRLPGVDEVLRSEAARGLLDAFPRPRAVEGVRAAIDEMRRDPGTGAASGGALPAAPSRVGPGRRPGRPQDPSKNPPSSTLTAVVERAAAWLAEDEFQRLRTVVNATGVILHTNLGRAVLPSSAVAALAAMDRCCSLQIDLDTGARGKRHAMSERLLCRLTGAEAALVVNNNAAATLLVLAALCAGREVVVSRGQLIEIGGSFRLPDCIHQSGARLVEVGTTNKTHLRDYEAALTERTAAVMRVNPSNYRIIGFTKDVPVSDLMKLKAKQPDLLVLDNLGCGALVDLTRFGLPHEPTVPESVRAGADLSFFSGDKLIGGPQAGILVGRAAPIAKIKKHPLTRMLRVDKMTDLVLERTLRLFLDPERLPETNPTWRMLTASAGSLRPLAEALASAAVAAGAPAETLRVVACASTTGGGSLPGHPIPSFAVAARRPGVSAADLLRRLRRNDPPVIGRIEDNDVLLDVRTLLDGEAAIAACALARALLPHSLGADPTALLDASAPAATTRRFASEWQAERGPPGGKRVVRGPA